MKQIFEGPLVGAHTSIAGGYFHAFERGKAVGSEAIQIFTKNASQWKAKPISSEEQSDFLRTWENSKIRTVAAHDSYLINLASPDGRLRARSRGALQEELKRCAILNIPYLVMHPGSHGGSGEEKGIKRIVENLNRIFSTNKNLPVMILVENTAGQGRSLGYRFEQLGMILDGVEDKARMGVCFDTCHAFASGYDLRTKKEFNRVFSEFDAIIGLEHLYLFHLNDAKRDLGERIDRHEHLGKGTLGMDPFRFLMTDPKFRRISMVIETPKEDNPDRWDKRNLNLLKRLRKEKGGKKSVESA